MTSVNGSTGDGTGAVLLAPTDVSALSDTGGGGSAVTALGAASGATDLDLAVASDWTMTATGDVTLSVSHVPPAGRGVAISILFAEDGAGAHTLTLPAGTVSVGSVDATAGAVSLVALITYDGGATWYSSLVSGFAA